MKISVCITNHNYARYLPRAIESALMHTDEVLMYDDGSTDDSVEVASQYPVSIVRREKASGGPVWGSNTAIKQARGDYLFYLDADNIMLDVPDLKGDYVYAPITLINDLDQVTGVWTYQGWPLTAKDAIRRFKATRAMPIPWGGFWRLDFLRAHNLMWEPWPSTMFGADFHTCVKWLMASPTLSYHPSPCLAFRQHEGQWSASPERALMQADANRLASLI
jgi:glycosyltransferase involved in cell wall biosynthesis